MTAGRVEQVKLALESLMALDPAQRAALLEVVEPGVRAEVESFLAARGEDRFIEKLPRGAESFDNETVEKLTAIRPPTESDAPDRVGPYRILRAIGEGGMGVVYEAEQQEPVRRKVALKLIKWGMDTKHVIARFESERQALALMNHPNIASVHDAGATLEGRPYFAMEYVHGIPITQYSDKNRLSIRARLELFILVCEGVQHAHQKGIIHRDIKPSNVLVAVQDGKPVPKIIDFGVAKAISQRLTEHTVATELGQLIGTPEYMSPEQAEMTNLDIDTRTDVYSLGVLLYELLVGELPFDPKELRRASLAEIQRKLREEEPPKPSIRLGGLSRASTASNRRIESKVLERQLKGDLDWITMTAMEKDRTRRYETANALGLEVERYLNNEPVRARGPSHSYRFRKFVQRHRGRLGALAAIGVGLAGFAVVYAVNISRARARAEIEAAKATAINEFLQEALGSANPYQGAGREVTLVEALRLAAVKTQTSFADQPEIRAAIERTIGKTYSQLGLRDDAEPLLSSALKIRKELFGSSSLDVADSLEDLADYHLLQDDLDEAERLARESVDIRRRLSGTRSLPLGRALTDLGTILYFKDDYDEAEALLREGRAMILELGGAKSRALSNNSNALAMLLDDEGEFEEASELFKESLALDRALLGDEHPDRATTLNNLGIMMSTVEGSKAAEPYFREALAIRRKTLGEHADTATSISQLGFALSVMGNLEESERLGREALEMRRRVLGNEHSSVAVSLNNLAKTLESKGDLEEAEALMREAISIRRAGGHSDPDLAISLSNLAMLVDKRGDLAAAELLHRESCSILQSFYGEDHWMPAHCASNFASLLTKRGRYAESENLLLGASDVLETKLGASHRRTLVAVTRLAELYEAWGQPDKTGEYRAVLQEAEAAK